MYDIHKQTAEMVNTTRNELGIKIQLMLVNEAVKETGIEIYIRNPYADLQGFQYQNGVGRLICLPVEFKFDDGDLTSIVIDTPEFGFISTELTLEDENFANLYRNIELAKHLNYECIHGDVGFIEESFLDYEE